VPQPQLPRVDSADGLAQQPELPIVTDLASTCKYATGCPEPGGDPRSRTGV